MECLFSIAKSLAVLGVSSRRWQKQKMPKEMKAALAVYAYVVLVGVEATHHLQEITMTREVKRLLRVGFIELDLAGAVFGTHAKGFSAVVGRCLPLMPSIPSKTNGSDKRCCNVGLALGAPGIPKDSSHSE